MHYYEGIQENFAPATPVFLNDRLAGEFGGNSVVQLPHGIGIDISLPKPLQGGIFVVGDTGFWDETFDPNEKRYIKATGPEIALFHQTFGFFLGLLKNITQPIQCESPFPFETIWVGANAMKMIANGVQYTVLAGC